MSCKIFENSFGVHQGITLRAVRLFGKPQMIGVYFKTRVWRQGKSVC